MTILIRKKDILPILSMKEAMDVVEEAFKDLAKQRVQMPPKIYLDFKKYNGDLRVMPCYIESQNIAGVKNATVHPQNKKLNLPTVIATITLIDPKTGNTLAFMDGTHITNMRTGAAGGIAAKYLSRPDSKIVALIGAGKQAKTQLMAIMQVRRIEQVTVYDLNTDAAIKLCKEISVAYGMQAIPYVDAKQAVKNADIIVTTTPSRLPVVMKQWVKAGTHINAIGADAPDKQELDPEILKGSKIIVDSWEQASINGEISLSLAHKMITPQEIHAELGEIILGRKKGREGYTDITIFDSTGLAVQDIATANYVYKKLKESGQKLPEAEFY